MVYIPIILKEGTLMKICGKCKQNYPESNFYKDSHKKDGLSWDCKQCASKKHKNIDKIATLLKYVNKTGKKIILIKNKNTINNYTRKLNFFNKPI